MKSSSSTFSRRDGLKLAGAAGVLSWMGWPASRARAADVPAPAVTQGAGFYRRKLGDVELIMLADGFFPFPAAYPLFGANASEQAVNQTLENHFIKPDNVSGQVHTLLIKTPQDLVMIDTGCGSYFGPTTGKLFQHMSNAGVKPADVTALVLTHAHRDHYGAMLNAENQRNFPNAEHIISKAELDFWSGDADLSKSGLPKEAQAEFIAEAKKVLKAVEWTTFEGEKDVRPKVRALPAPGHTPGHLTVLIDGGADKQLYYITDTVHHYAIVMPHPEYYVAFDTDRDQAVATRKKVLDRAASDRLLVAGTHLPFPAVGHVRKAGDGFEWAPEPWQW